MLKTACWYHKMQDITIFDMDYSGLRGGLSLKIQSKAPATLGMGNPRENLIGLSTEVI